MNVDARLRQLIEGEKSVSAPPSAGAQGWERLASAVTSGVPAIAVPRATIQLTTVSTIAKSAAPALVAGAIGAAAAVGTTMYTSHTSTAPNSSSSVTLETKRVFANLVENVERVPDAEVPFVAAQSAQPGPLPKVPNKSPEAPASSALPTSTLDDELRLIARAKGELDRGQSHLAQVWLDEHRSRFPAGVLSAERDGLSVIMACGSAHSADARARAQDYAMKYPGSPLLDRIFRACSKSSESEIPK